MRVNRAKIVATVGPACDDYESLKGLIQAGMNVCRVNFSHSPGEKARQIIQRVRKINAELNTNVAILADLQGPKLRVGEMAPDTLLEGGSEFVLTTRPGVGDHQSAYVNYDELARDVRAGETILLDDGNLALEVLSTNGDDEVITQVRFGGKLTSRKGVNLPDTRLSLPSMTPKDHEDVRVAIEEEVEWIALSFVRRGQDIESLREVITAVGAKSLLISKIEKPEAIEDIDAIIERSDGLMVARGDLGVEMPMEEVPELQKMMVDKCRAAAKPIIIATQMMESMISNIRPTRAEVSDVANSVLDGADALMLSGETSVGMHPVRVVEVMRSIVARVETGNAYKVRQLPTVGADSRVITDAICFQACALANQMEASAVITMTRSGYAACKISSNRPDTNIFVFTNNRAILNTLSLVWGIRSFYYDGFVSTDESIQDIHRMLREEALISEGDLVVNIASMPIKERAMTNTLKLSMIS